MAIDSSAEPATIQVDIAAMKPGLEPDGFTFGRTGNGGPGEWRVVNDPTATGQTAIAQTSTDTTGYRFPVAIYQPCRRRMWMSSSGSSRLAAR